MAERPKVSVITPTYNRSELLPRAIQSVLSQDFSDLELLIVDDGSTDNTAEVVGAIQAQDNRVRYYNLHKNQGIGFAREYGLRQARGEYIAWVDSDDLWLPGKLRLQVDILEKYSTVEVLFCDFLNIDNVSGVVSRSSVQTREGFQHLIVSKVDDYLYLIKDGFETGLLIKTFIQLGTVIFRSAITDVAGGFNTNLSGSEDLEFCWRAAVSGVQFAYYNRVLEERHINDSSVTQNKIHSMRRRMDALDICCGTCKKAHRFDLLIHLRAAKHRTLRNLIREYGHDGQRTQAMSVYRESLHLGFSMRSFLFLLAALIGTHAVSFLGKVLLLRRDFFSPISLRAKLQRSRFFWVEK